MEGGADAPHPGGGGGGRLDMTDGVVEHSKNEVNVMARFSQRLCGFACHMRLKNTTVQCYKVQDYRDIRLPWWISLLGKDIY